ncbi:MAG: acetyltransferase [Lentimicrobium sp.]|nr:acetyltransferase [Lentimicrobium sp.]
MDKALIIGAGTYGQVYASYLAESNLYKVIGFLDDDVNKIGSVVHGIRVLGAVTMLNELLMELPCSVFVPIGNNITRETILNKARGLGYKTPSYIHSSCQVHSTVTVGESVYMLPASNIMPHTVIEDNVMISMGVNVAHHTRLGRCSFYSQGANVGASIDIEPYAFAGIGCTIMTGISRVGRNAVIGAGAVVIKDIPDGAVVVGNPARILRIDG